MNFSTPEGKHGIWWTAQNQLEYLDSLDELAFLSRTHEQIQMKTASVAAVNFNIHKDKRSSSNTNGELQLNLT
ncbi:unnamed protein product [Schistosoma margrebowiei]|uniref:Uncharacterized protein n=1 Tax=Schistosoma margrebowiei TaxID=48269 RepID=A0A183MA85_9TREM|nr:unnamed protein product [Schistosoma margrebowiei]